MHFKLDPDHLALQSAAREFAQGELRGIAKTLEHDDSPPLHDLIRRFADLGFLGINVPTRLGGLGLGNLEALILLEEFAAIAREVAGDALQLMGACRLKQHVDCITQPGLTFRLTDTGAVKGLARGRARLVCAGAPATGRLLQ